MKIGVLTSSRADFGCYTPLLEKLKSIKNFKIEIIAFGMHLIPSQGKTIDAIKKKYYDKLHVVGPILNKDSVYDIANNYGKIILFFSEFWLHNKYDLVFVYGDRWEMSAAVQASIPFEIKLAHLHGGETTLGATDNIYRHQITLASEYHFTAADEFSKRVASIIGNRKNIYTTGAITLSSHDYTKLPKWSDVAKLFKIKFDKFILVTFHPETVNSLNNDTLSNEMYKALRALAKNYNLLITYANADISGSVYNNKHIKLEKLFPENVKVVHSLGRVNYATAMRHCQLMLGNSSSGIVEAASFNTWVINVGDRQKGRLKNLNTIDVSFNSIDIIDGVKKILRREKYNGKNKYYKANSVSKIIEIIIENE